MGRTANPVNYDVPTRGYLAELLRTEKAATTYDELATRAGVSAATLKRAASGKVTPSEAVIDAFLAACGSTPHTILAAKSLRRRARRDELGGYTRSIRTTTINTADMLADALQDLYRNAGAPTYREMQARAGGAYELPLSSISRMLRRQMLPVDERQMRAFVKGCHVPQREQDEWVEAWRRVKERSSHSIHSRLLLTEWLNTSIFDAAQRAYTKGLMAPMADTVTADEETTTDHADVPALDGAMAPLVAAAEKQPDMSPWAAAMSPLAEAARRLLRAAELPRLTTTTLPPAALDTAA
ncbi:helix-turn-helix domain-containing protein [Streptomyces sp. NPDC057695]|uniref:helix-turn-helix domain-containing protein n=1 Tax=Streptomyces sp. NPDC057695 TaxID=3346217 RepID=UPI0036A2CFD1